MDLKPVGGLVVMGDRSKVGGGSMWFGADHVSSTGSSRLRLRSRLGIKDQSHSASNEGRTAHSVDRNLLPGQYWALYKSTPDVRACVDSIVRRIATWNFDLEVVHDPRDVSEYERLRRVADDGVASLNVPNKNGETWQEVQTRVVTDLLIYEAGVCELTIEDGRLAEIVPWLGCEWIPVYNEKNVLLHYDQYREDGGAGATGVPPEKILYYSLFRNNRGPLGLALLDTLVDECVTVLLASEHAMLALDADEIPPGLLVLGGVAGAAAQRARADLQQMKGRDHRLRVLSSPQPSGIQAEWIELRHTMKDLEMIQVVEAMRRAIWRTFGVMPVELGVSEGVPRASATVQVDVSSSHLITPILELIEAKLNAQVVPLIVGKEDAQKIKFRFDRDQPLTPAQRLDQARSQDLRVRRGIITVNEARAEQGRLPIDGGDVAIVDTNEGPVPLTEISSRALPPKPDEDLERGMKEKCVHNHAGGLKYRELVGRIYRSKREDWLPSAWPNASKFKNVRTIDLNSLADAVMDYGSVIGPAYFSTVGDVVALLVDAQSTKGDFGPVDAQDLLGKMYGRIDALFETWVNLSLPFYEDAARVASVAAQEFTDVPSDFGYKQKAKSYHEQAMVWLNEPDGLMSALKAACKATVDSLPVDRETLNRSELDENLPEEPSPGEAAVGLSVSMMATAHRIDNWTGKIVGLANEVLVDALNSTASVSEGVEVYWMAEWVNAGGRSCPICVQEGSLPIRPLSAFSRKPGQDTYCMGNCRCVLVFWTGAEVQSGAAIPMSALAPR